MNIYIYICIVYHIIIVMIVSTGQQHAAPGAVRLRIPAALRSGLSSNRAMQEYISYMRAYMHIHTHIHTYNLTGTTNAQTARIDMPQVSCVPCESHHVCTIARARV